MGNTIEVPVRIGLGISRSERRARCSVCTLYRVVYRIVAASLTGGDATDARCAECWGMRETEVDESATQQDDAADEQTA